MNMLAPGTARVHHSGKAMFVKWVSWLINEYITTITSCLNGGTCNNYDGTWNCTCPPQWKGYVCQMGKMANFSI